MICLWFIIVPEETLYNNLIIGVVAAAEPKVSLGNDKYTAWNLTKQAHAKELKSGDSYSTCILFTFYNRLPADTIPLLSNTSCPRSRPLSLLSNSSSHQHHLFLS